MDLQDRCVVHVVFGVATFLVILGVSVVLIVVQTLLACIKAVFSSTIQLESMRKEGGYFNDKAEGSARRENARFHVHLECFGMPSFILLWNTYAALF